MTPVACSWHWACAGNTADNKSSVRMRMICSGVFFPARERSTASDRVAFQRQRTWNMGARSAAWVSASSTVAGETKSKTLSSGKLCCGPSESRIASSLAAACSSKSNVRQNFLRSASPKARLRRAPKGACTTSCMPPASSKNRSAISVCCVGSAPSAALPAERYATSCSAPAGVSAHSSATRAAAAGSWPPSIASTSARREDTSPDSSALRPGASPRQKGTLGGWPCAFSTRMRPSSILRMRHDSLPSWKMSPAIDSTAKSSSSEPITVPSGSASTAY